MSKRNAASLKTFALFALGGLLEVPLVFVMAGAYIRVLLVPALLLHLVSAVLVFLAPPWEKGLFNPARHWAQPLALLALLVPGLGWVTGAWLLFSHPDSPYAKDAYRFEDDAEEDVNPLAGLGTAAAIRRDLADALDVLPAADALLGQDPAMKRGAIETLAKIRTLEAVRWIFKARGDPDAEVRFYATTALTRLKRDFEVSVQAAEREAFRRPGELAPQLTLQRVRLEYAASGMVDGGARQAVLEECRRRLLGPAEREPEALRLLYMVERHLAPERALGVLRRLAGSQPENKRWLREEAELLFSMGRHAEVRRLLRERRDTFGAPDEGSAEDREWRSTALWWADA